MRYWILLQLTLAPLTAFLLALPFWRKGGYIFGNIVGTVVLFGTAIGLILREYVAIDRIVQACFAEGRTCFPEPSPFARFAIYATIGLVQVFALFLLSLRAEKRQRDQDYAPEWR